MRILNFYINLLYAQLTEFSQICIFFSSNCGFMYDLRRLFLQNFARIFPVTSLDTIHREWQHGSKLSFRLISARSFETFLALIYQLDTYIEAQARAQMQTEHLPVSHASASTHLTWRRSPELRAATLIRFFSK